LKGKEKMKFTKITEYKADAVSIRFIPVSNIPGFTHSVDIVLNHKLVVRDWLSKDFQPSEKNATYFYGKHLTKINELLKAVA